MNAIYIGTSGYSYTDWIGPFYPKDLERRNFLSFYAQEFNTVELNFSYYRQPDVNFIRRMINKTDNNFIFSIKAHKSLTHEICDNFNQDVDTFKRGINPLVESAKLGSILVQFPYSFHYKDETRRHIARLCDSLHDYPVAIEFRNNEWFKESVINEFKERAICLVNVDEPNLPKLIKPSSYVTTNFAYIRFHGRNKKNWWQGDNVSRYDYLYNDDELTEWISLIKKIVKQVKMLLIAFNNHSRGQAVENSRRIKELLKEHNFKDVY